LQELDHLLEYLVTELKLAIPEALKEKRKEKEEPLLEDPDGLKKLYEMLTQLLPFIEDGAPAQCRILLDSIGSIHYNDVLTAQLKSVQMPLVILILTCWKPG
jgi:hypothetical protein